MSFGTVLPYACIMDGPQVLQWWSDVEEKGSVKMAAAANGDGSSVTPGLASLSLYLSVSGMLLFLHSAVRGQGSDTDAKPRKNASGRILLSATRHVQDYTRMLTDP